MQLSTPWDKASGTCRNGLTGIPWRSASASVREGRVPEMAQAEERGALRWWWAVSWTRGYGVSGGPGSQQSSGCMNRDVGHRLREGIVPLHLVLLRAQLETVSRLGSNIANTWINWGELEGALPGGWPGALVPWGEAEGAGLVQPRDKTGLGASHRPT